MSKKQFNTFSFNNFKPFGEKMQPFSKKSITLIYGPNSIGKSSFIHMASYLRYIFETESFNLTDTNIFGDEINLGGFEKFVHKRDKNNIITFEFSFDDCTPAIMEYLGLSSMDFTHIKALHSFTKEEIIQIMNNSEKYIHDSGICSKISYMPIPNDRRHNYLCNKISQSEFKYFCNHLYGIDSKEYINNSVKFEDTEIYLSMSSDKKLTFYHHDEFFTINTFLTDYYSVHPYIKSYESVSPEDGSTESIAFYNLYNNEGKFHNNDCKNCFISDILIPEYINFAKYFLIGNFVDSTSDGKAIDLHPSEIETIADNTLKMINTIYEMFSYYNLLKSKKVPLKITMEIEHTLKIRDNDFHKKLDEIRLKSTKYFIDNTLYDTAEEIICSDDFGKLFYFTAAASYDYTDFDLSNVREEGKQLTNQGEFGLPQIFDVAPDICKLLIINKHEVYTGADEIAQKHFEKNNSIFLSYKKGYNKLIGALNDMINFKKMQYIGPLRFYPERESYFKELPENSIKIPNSRESWSLLQKDVKLRDKINEWLKNPNKLKTPYKIRYRKLYDIESSFFDLDFEKLNKVKNAINERHMDIKAYGISLNMQEDDKQIAASKLAKKLATEYLISTNIKYSNRQLELTTKDLELGVMELIEDLIEFSTLSIEDKFRKILMDDGAFHALNNVEAKEEMVFVDLRNNTQISNRDLGLGISQILPILIATNSNQNMAISVEQPELHLHPAVQCEIADEFIRSYKENKNEFLIETHSEHLLLRIMKRMRHTAEDREGRDKTLDLTPDDVCLLYVDADENSTYIKELRLSKKGKLLDHWPGGFFEEGYKERFQ